MSRSPNVLPVTIVCATLNAFDAVRLTFRSLLRHTPRVARILVADNGSTDGTLEWLQSVDELTVIPLEHRRRLVHAELAWSQSVTAALDRRGTAPAAARERLEERPKVALEVLTNHGATLDWLAERVTTPYFLTLDSDVEFLAGGWLEDMLELVERESLAALGPLELGRGRYRARLAPHVLLLRTSDHRALGESFRGTFCTDDPDERARWIARRTWYLDVDELADFPTTTAYPTGAYLFEQLDRAGHRWKGIPGSIEERFVHYGQMSWGGAADDAGGAAAIRAEHGPREAQVRERLRFYEPAEVVAST